MVAVCYIASCEKQMLIMLLLNTVTKLCVLCHNLDLYTFCQHVQIAYKFYTRLQAYININLTNAPFCYREDMTPTCALLKFILFFFFSTILLLSSIDGWSFTLLLSQEGYFCSFFLSN